METYVGNIKLIRVKEHKDGSATYELEYDSKFKKSLKKSLGIKRLTKKKVAKVITEGLINLAKEIVKGEKK